MRRERAILTILKSLRAAVSEQPAQGRAVGEHVGALLAVKNGGERIDAETLIKGGHQVRRRDRLAGRIRGDLIARTQHATALNAAAGQHDTEARRPVISTAILVETRRAAEFAHHDDQGFVEQSAHVEILDQ